MSTVLTAPVMSPLDALELLELPVMKRPLFPPCDPVTVFPEPVTSILASVVVTEFCVPVM